MLILSLLEPKSTLRLDARGWHRLLLLARQHGLLAKLDARLAALQLLDSVPDKARSQMHAARIATLSSQTAVRFEVNRVLRALRGSDIPILLMKGSAYLHAGLPPAAGRFVGDVDLMVPRGRIDEIERKLVEHGWVAADLDAYGQRYYREWAHEIPPLQHPERDTPLDIHHTISPLTSRVHPDAAAILSASVPLADARLRVMGPADMVLHSALHLVNDEVSMPLRDLFDLHDLLGHFSPLPGFWDDLLQRAELHGLQRVLYHLHWHTRDALGTEWPGAVSRAVTQWAPSPLVRPLLRRLLRAHFAPTDPDRPGAGKTIAETALYMRAHWLRMPPLLLARHLSIKAWKRLRQGPAQ